MRTLRRGGRRPVVLMRLIDLLGLRQFFFSLFYRVGRPPWDRGVTPPELIEVVEGPNPVTRSTLAVALARTASTWRATAGASPASISPLPPSPAPKRRRGWRAHSGD